MRELTVGGMVDTRYEKEEVEEKTFTVKPGQPFGSAQLATQKAGSYAIELSGQGREGTGELHAHHLLLHGRGRDPVAALRRETAGDRAGQEDLLPGRHGASPHQEPPREGDLPGHRGEGRRAGEAHRGPDGQRARPSTSTSPRTTSRWCTCSSPPPRRAPQPPADGPDAPDFGKPRGYSGLPEIPVDTASRTITLEISNSKDSYLPGHRRGGHHEGHLERAAAARAPRSRWWPRTAGVLDLIDYRVPNPVDFFYSRGNFPDRVAHFDSRDMLMDPVTWKANDLPGGDEKGESAPAGRARRCGRTSTPRRSSAPGSSPERTAPSACKFKLPDLLTQFRSTAVAVKDDTFGITEGEILVQNPINVRTALPRRMRVGDAATAGVVLTNLDARPHTVTIGLQRAGLAVQGDSRKTVTPEAGRHGGGRLRPLRPGRGNGAARLQRGLRHPEGDGWRTRWPSPTAHVNGVVHHRGQDGGPGQGRPRRSPRRSSASPEEGLYLTLDSTIASVAGRGRQVPRRVPL